MLKKVNNDKINILKNSEKESLKEKDSSGYILDEKRRNQIMILIVDK